MDSGNIDLDFYIDRLEIRIRKIYEEAEKDISRKIDEFTSAYKVKEAAHVKDVQDGRWTQEQFDNWKRGQIFQGQQWRDKRDQIVNTLYNANMIATRMANDQCGEAFTFNANYQAYALEHGAGVNFGFQLYDSTTVANLIQHDPQILPQWKIDRPKDYVWNYKNVNNAVTQGIIQGEKLDQIADRLSKGLSAKNRNKMLTFARTGMTQAQNSGRLQRLGEAKRKEIKVRKRWMATLDERTRWQHADLDGQVQETDKDFVIGDYRIRYPGDPQAHPSMVYNCRCTLVGVLVDYPSEYDRYDNIEGKPIGNMTYREWEKAKGKQFSKSKAPIVKEFNQVSIGLCKTVQEVNDLLNSGGLWRTNGAGVVLSQADLTGCDLDSAKSIAAAYEQVFTKYPQLKGKLDAPDAHPIGMKDSTYAWCYIRNGGKVQVNPGPERYGNWGKIQKQYERDVLSGWHPKGTTAESIVTHEIGHAVDGLLARKGISGGVAADGSYRYASSTMRNTIMKRVAKKDPIMQQMFDIWGGKEGMEMAVHDYVSQYATKNPQEWFAECFAEYITSANPRIVATEFGKELEKLVGRLDQ